MHNYRLYFYALLALLVLPLLAVPASAQTPGDCRLGASTVDLTVNNVRARLYNNGGLFWRGAGNVYNVPRAPDGQPISPNGIFASGIWIAGKTGNQVRSAAQAYGNWEYWPGPLDAAGNPPADCAVYDHIYLVSREQINDYEAGNGATPDIENWPYQLGAPVLDGDGDPNNYNLAGGDRPDILGDQMAWWIMNDVGAVHENTGTPPIGMEIRVSAFAFNLAGDLGNTTFYKYELTYKGSQPLTDTWFGIWSDPDLGNASDDYVGSDTTLGLGFVYNADNEDEGSDGYGSPAPALGYDFFQGPLVDAPGQTFTDPDGTVHENQTRLKMTRFMYYNNDGSVIGNPRGRTTDWYNYLQGIWQDNQRMCIGGNGHPDLPPGPCSGTADFMYPGEPATQEFWSEYNIDDNGTANTPSDRRFLMSTGPFTLNPGDVQEIVYGIVWARGSDNLSSVTAMKAADALAQSAFDANFQIPAGPAAPRVTATELDEQVVLTWDYLPSDNNYLERYEVDNPFSFGPDTTYNFEGYRVLQFTTNEFDPTTATLLATYDVQNGVGEVRETGPTGLIEITARGSDTGTQNYHIVNGLTNYEEYYFGVQAYAYNGDTDVNKVYNGPLSRITVIPSRSRNILSEEAVDLASDLGDPDRVAARSDANVGDGVVAVDVVNPGAVRDAEYTVRYYNYECSNPAGGALARQVFTEEEADNRPMGVNGEVLTSASKSESATCLTYDVLRDGEVVFNGSSTQTPAPQREGVLLIDGLNFSITGPSAGIKNFFAISNAAGPLDPFEMGAFAFNSNGFPTLDGLPPDGENDRPSSNQQVGEGAWGINAGGGDGTFASYNSRAFETRGQGYSELGPYDYEIRFTEECAATIDGEVTADDCLSYRRFEDGVVVEVPFEIWRTGINTPDDPSDDVRLIAGICETACGNGTADFVFDIGGDHPVSGGADDPTSDWIYWLYYGDEPAPGEGGYNEFFAGGAAGLHEIFARQVIVNWNGGAEAPYDQALPEPGTTIRYVTNKPNQPGDVFTINTTGLGTTAPDQALQEASLDEIGIVPNPYKGASTYEVSNLSDLVRFTNMPEEATIRVFTLSGSLIRTLVKSGPERTLEWDLQTEAALPIASGIYLVHVEVPGVGSKVIKFGVIKKRIQLDLL
ncbi:MAG TPA: T9SS type A sorting domain-containing protein [Rhodothermales bacterium]|nr:T9SS type A sorting domain-containing protein [Rhodothermales bacterium]